MKKATTSRPKEASARAVEDIPSQALDESIGFLLNETSRLSRRLLYGRLAECGIRGGSWYVLRVLWEGDGVTQRQLAERLGMTQPSTLEMIRSMERDDLIRLERDQEDRRKTRVYLTDRAWDLRVPLLRVAEEATAVVVQRLSQPEQVALRMLLRNVRDTTAEALGRQASEDEAAVDAERAAPPAASRTAAKAAAKKTPARKRTGG